MKFNSLIILIFISILAVSANAQNSTSSPYTRYGVGNLENTGYGRNVGLASTGLAIRDSSYINLKNPASLTSIDTLSVLYETGFHFRYELAQSTNHTQGRLNGNLSHFSLAHRITPWLMSSFGLMPYSSVGYTILTSSNIEGEYGDYNTTWSGTGGLTKTYYSLGMKVFKNFSIGAEATALFGPFGETQVVYAPGVSTEDSRSYYNSDARYFGVGVKAGAQYTANLGNGSSVTVGGTYSPQTRLNGRSDLLIFQSYQGTYRYTIKLEQTTAKPLFLAENYGVGVSTIIKNKYLIAADFEKANWGNITTSEHYKDQTKYSIGFERMAKGNSLKYFERCAFRAGVSYDDGYLQFDGISVNDVKLTLGMSLPVLKTRTMVNVGFELGQRGSKAGGLVRERYAKAVVSFSFHDYWFVKSKFD